jgi:ABC-type Fe3+ transport system permease subunit
MQRTGSLRGPGVVLGLLYVCFFGCLAVAKPSLPAHMATHWDGSGQPDGWMSASDHLQYMIVFGLTFPLVVPALCFICRFFPRGWNIPHRDYWLAPERRGEFFGYVFRHSLWFACLALLFVMGVHFSILHANASAPASFSPLLVLALAGPFLVGTAIWVTTLIRHLNRVP